MHATTRRMALALGAGLGLARGARAQAPSPIRLVAFAGASNLPVWVGQSQGIFARHGVEATLDITPNSRAMANDLFAGRYDVALTSVDNIVAYTEGQGEAQLPGQADFVALFGVDDGMLSVMAAPEVPDLAGLRGRDVSVDAMTTGFAFVLREILSRQGLADAVNWVAVGGGAQRLTALREGRQAATLLNTPLDLIAEAAGFRRLVRAQDVIGPYQGIVGAARRGVVAERRDALVRFTRGFREAVAWTADPAHAEAARVLLQARAGMAPPVADRALAALTDPDRGIRRDLSISQPGMATVLRLRSAYATPPRALQDPMRYQDPSIRQAALA
jgi:ABC-type nitrate/sulfonate/bicarbonate transport system substrate-binding protein